MIEKNPPQNENVNLNPETQNEWDGMLRMANLIDHGFFIVQTNGGKILRANSYASKLTGYSVPELIGKPISQLHTGDELPLLQLEMQRLEFERETEVEGLHLIKKNGLHFPVDIKLSRLPDAGTEGPLAHFIAIYKEAHAGSWQDAYARRNEELVTLMEMGQTMASALNLEEIIDLSLIKLGTLTGASYAALFLADSLNAVRMFRAQKIPPEEIVLFDQPWKVGVEEGPFLEALQNRHLVQVKNVFENSHFEYLRPIAERIDYTAFISVPLIPKDVPIGVLNFYYQAERDFPQDEINFLRTAATYLAISIENSQLYRRYQEKTGQIAALNKILNSVNSSLDLEEVIRIIAAEVKKIIQFDFISVMLFDDSSKRTKYFPLGSRELAQTIGHDKWRPIDNSGLGWVTYLSETELGEAEDADRILYERRAKIEKSLQSRMRALLLSKGKYIGTLSLGTLEAQAYNPEHEALLKQIASQISTALENALLYQEVKRSLMEYSALTDVSNALSSSLNKSVVINSIVKAAAVAMGAKVSTIWFLGKSFRDAVKDPDNGVFQEMLASPLREKLNRMVQEMKPLAVRDLQREGFHPPELPDHPLGGNLHSYLGVPIISRGKTIAILSAYWEDYHQFDQREVRLLTAIASQAAIALENAHLFDRERKRAAQLAMVNEVGKKIASTLNFNHLLDNVVRAIFEIFSYRNVALYLFDKEKNTLVLKSQQGQLSQLLPVGTEIALQEGPIYKAFEIGKTVLINDLTQEERVEAGYPEQGALLNVPLKIANRSMGVLALLSEQPNTFDLRDVNAFEALSGQLSSAIQNALLFEETQRNTTKLKKANEELENFVFTVSHDLKSPIVSISGFASILVSDYRDKLDEEAFHYLERIRGNAKLMENLIHDLLNLSRIGRVTNPVEKVQMGQIVEAAVEDLQLQLREKNVRVDVAVDFPEVTCDRERMLQVFTNLISNAVKYMGDQPNPRIEIGFKDAGEAFQFFVKDNGIGINPKYHEQIFKLFHTLNEVKEAESTGVGLTIVKRIVENHKGKVWVESQSGQGATFYFTLPKQSEIPGENVPK